MDTPIGVKRKKTLIVGCWGGVTEARDRKLAKFTYFKAQGEGFVH